MKVKLDEENFDEAEAQAYRCWSEAKVRLLIMPSPVRHVDAI